MQEDAGRMSGTLHLAQALSNRGRRGRKNDFRDAERLLKRLVSQELILSFVPDGEQRLWRTVTRTKYQLRRDRVRLQNQLEALLEEAHITLSSLVSDLLGASARRMLQALADGETDAQALAALADRHLQATPEQLRDALGACSELCLSKTSKCLSGRHLYCFRKTLLACSFFSRHSSLLCVLSSARALPSNSRTWLGAIKSACCSGRQQNARDYRRRPPIVDRAVPHLA